MFARGDRLMQQPFDLNQMRVTGEPTPVIEQVLYNPGSGRADFSVSANGVLAFRSSTNRSSQFAWFDRTGKLLETIGPPGNYRTPDLSPDGRFLAYGDVNQRDIWIFDLSRRISSRFTSGAGSETAPVWFPDGSKIAYRSDQGGMFEKDVTGTGTERVLLKENVNGPDQVSADGKWVLYFKVTPNGNQDIYAIPTTGDRTPQMIAQTPFPDVEPQFSPNVRWLAYASSENGRNEVYVQAFPSTEPALAGLEQRWPSTAVARRRQGTVLRRRRSTVLRGRRVRARWCVRIRRAAVLVRHARQRVQLEEQLHPESRRQEFPREHAARRR